MADLLNGERVFLSVDDLRPADLVIWLYAPRGGWGFVSRVDGVVVRGGKSRVTIEVPLRAGGLKRVSVSPATLRRRGAAKVEG